jgi:hypothetical protein
VATRTVASPSRGMIPVTRPTICRFGQLSTETLREPKRYVRVRSSTSLVENSTCVVRYNSLGSSRSRRCNYRFPTQDPTVYEETAAVSGSCLKARGTVRFCARGASLNGHDAPTIRPGSCSCHLPAALLVQAAFPIHLRRLFMIRNAMGSDAAALAYTNIGTMEQTRSTRAISEKRTGSSSSKSEVRNTLEPSLPLVGEVAQLQIGYRDSGRPGGRCLAGLVRPLLVHSRGRSRMPPRPHGSIHTNEAHPRK